MSVIVPPDGPIPARVMIVGEAPGADEESKLCPFVGISGQEMNRMLHEAGLSRSECFATNVVNQRPLANDFGVWVALKKKDISPQHILLRDKYVLPIVKEGYVRLIAEIETVKPKMIIAFGNWAMWALTGKFGITKWRGSMLTVDTEEMKRWL